VSHSRRENELLRVIEGFGGIVNFHTREFFDAHTALIESMVQAGEPTSSIVGARLDKRTADAAIESMEARGRIKRLKTSVVTSTGASRPACVIYLPDTEQEKLNSFLGDLGRTTPLSQTAQFKKIDEPVEYGAGRKQVKRSPVVLPAEQPGEVRHKEKKRTHGEKAKRAADTKALLARKAAESKIQREKDWDDILHRTHPEPLKGSIAARVRRIRARFLQSGSGKDIQKWDREINEAVRETTMAASKLLKKRPSLSQNVATKHPPPVIVNPQEKSVESLVAMQGSLPRSADKKGKGKKRANEEDLEEGWFFTMNVVPFSFTSLVQDVASTQARVRRQRFQWNWDYDELARDASAIIKARCRNGPKLDLAAFEQVFPAVPRNSVRQRLAHLRETPGNDAYLNRLEDKWYELWIQHRGTSLLPDKDPQSPSNFNMIAHIEFLRKHVDKNAL
jgi:hypothetical protein